MTYRSRDTSQQTNSTRKQRGDKAHDCNFSVTVLASGRQLTNSEGRAGRLKNFLVGTKDFEMFALSNQSETAIDWLFGSHVAPGIESSRRISCHSS